MPRHVFFEQPDRQRRRISSRRRRSADRSRGAAIYRRHHRLSQGRRSSPTPISTPMPRSSRLWAPERAAGPRENAGGAAAVSFLRHDGGDEPRPDDRRRDDPACRVSAQPRPWQPSTSEKPTIFIGVPTMFSALIEHRDIAQVRSLEPQILHLRRRAAAARGAAPLRGADRLQAGRGLWPERSKPGLHRQSARRRQARIGGIAAARHGRSRSSRSTIRTSSCGPASAAKFASPARRSWRVMPTAPGKMSKPSAAPGCIPAMSAISTKTAISSSSTASRI